MEFVNSSQVPLTDGRHLPQGNRRTRQTMTASISIHTYTQLHLKPRFGVNNRGLGQVQSPYNADTSRFFYTAG